MRDQIEIKRKQLKQEIDYSEMFLKRNLKNLNVGKYIVPSTDFLTDKVEYLISNPKDSIASLDMMTRSILPKSNIFRRILKYLNLGMKLFNQFSPPHVSQENH